VEQALLRSLLLPPAEEAAARLRGAHALDADPSCAIDASALCRARARLERAAAEEGRAGGREGGSGDTRLAHLFGWGRPAQCAEKLLADLALLAAVRRGVALLSEMRRGGGGGGGEGGWEGGGWEGGGGEWGGGGGGGWGGWGEEGGEGGRGGWGGDGPAGSRLELLRTSFRAAVAAGYPPPLARAGVALACSSDTTVSEAVRLMPKWRELTALLSRHAAEQPHSRAIVFVGRRDTVSALCAVLSDGGGGGGGGGGSADLLRVSPFVGQARASHSDGAGAAGMPQAEQQRVLAAFRAGAINVLIATSVAEEGLDIGQVDLIVCLDAVASPIRLVQRFGRTGACYSRDPAEIPPRSRRDPAEIGRRGPCSEHSTAASLRLCARLEPTCSPRQRVSSCRHAHRGSACEQAERGTAQDGVNSVSSHL